MTKCRRPVYCFRYFVLFSLFGSIWIHWLFSLFCTVLTLKRQISENSKTSKCFQKQLLLDEPFRSFTVFADLSFQCQNGAK
jgi:hypothetical protein